MASGSRSGSFQSDIRSEFSTKEGVYRNIKASEHCRPSRQALLSKELSPVRVSLVGCKDSDGHHEWILFNSGKELYFYRFEGVGKVLLWPLDCVTAALYQPHTWGHSGVLITGAASLILVVLYKWCAHEGKCGRTMPVLEASAVCCPDPSLGAVGPGVEASGGQAGVQEPHGASVPRL